MRILILLLLSTTSIFSQGIMLAGGAVAETGEFAPTDIDNCVAWFDASDFDGDGVNEGASENFTGQPWINKGSNGDDLSIALSAPSLITDNINLGYQNSVYFDGNDAYRGSAKTNWKFLHDGTQHTIFIVSRPSTPATSLGVVYATIDVTTNIGTYFVHRYNSGEESIMYRVSSGSVVTSVITEADSYQVNDFTFHRVEADPGNSTLGDRAKIYREGTLLGGVNTSNGTVNTGDPTGNFTLGGRISLDNYFYTGYVSEIIFYDRALTSEEKTNIENYLSTKYGL